MRVLIITGDKSFGPGNERYELQRSAVDELAVVYWGRGSLWPKIPKGKFDVVTSQDPFWRGLFAWFIARRIGAKFNVQIHTDLSVQSFSRHMLMQIVLRHADSIRVVSEKIKKQIENIHVRAPIHILPIYVDVSRFRNIERKPHEGKVILWLGRFEPEKDPTLVFSVFKKVRDIVDTRLVMLGKGSLEQSLRTQAKGLSVEFPGWQDPLQYYAIADVVLCTSKHESYGASIIEALAAGVPVVSPDVGIAKEAGAIVAARSDLAGAVTEVLQESRRGELKLHILNKDEWARAWRETL